MAVGYIENPQRINFHITDDIKLITSCQIRAARAVLNWSAQQLADKTGLGVATIRRMELSDGVPSSNAQNLALVKSCFERLGIEFIGGPDDAPGLRLHKALSQ